MGSTKLPLRHRMLPVLAIAFGAPVCAEFLQAYLPSTGDAPEVLLSLLILAPLYGGTALLIREVAVRRGLGWTGVLLLAAAFGVAMPGLVDLSLFVEHRDDIAYWDELRQGTFVAELGIAVFPTMSWVAGHVFMSVGAPLAVLEAFASRHRGRPLLGPVGTVVTAGLCVLAALLIRADSVRLYGQSGLTRTLVVLAVIVALGLLALTRAGQPIEPGQVRPMPVWSLALIGAVGMFSFDILPATWTGVTIMTVLLVVVAALLWWWSSATAWSPKQVAALAAGALIGRTLIGFLAPLPDGVSLLAKLSQNTLLLAAVLALAWLLTYRRASRDSQSAAPAAESGSSAPLETAT
ncbi:hypothetical protein E1258_12335 [Micromonospora sp. KC207]|uniref:hypothetical protein n=1 Tax=Micromonospora sp. KC207 TaxID=2530377 RepID=UPI0010467E73|nr:hypothetical protein [Micromonospora sp. KC207]TDC61209.1 hypothetical protein E1258_12335 [Micromonospora sp. KC207]